MLPDGWERIRLSEGVSKIGSGVTPRGGEEAYKSEGFPLVRSQNVGWGRLLLGNVCFIDSEQHDAMTGTKLKAGDVLLNITGASIGRVASYYGDDFGANVNQHVCIIRSDGSLEPRFIEAFLLSEFGQKQVDQFQAGGNRQGLNFEQVGSFRLPRPPLPEQRKIAEILATWDAAISAQERLIANARAQKKALMQTLLPTGAQPPKKRLPGFSGAWREHELGEIATFKGGCGFKESYQGKTSGEWPFIKVSDMNLPGNEQEIFHSQNWVDRPDAKAMRANPMPPRAIVFAKVGAALMLNRRRRLTRPTIIDNNMMAAIPDEKSITSDFLFLHMKTVDLGKFAQASAVPSVNQQHLAELPIILPPLAEQRKIAEILSTWDAEIFAQERLIANACAQKKALMQQLLTGKRRVKLEEAAR